MSTLKEIELRGDQIKVGFNSREELFNEVEQVYFMEDNETQAASSRFDNVKLTLSPDGANMLNGAVRLMTATDPSISISEEMNGEIGKDLGDRLEMFAQKMWGASGKISQSPVHFDLVLSGMLYSDVDLGIITVADLVKYYEGMKSPARLRRAKDALKRTPVLYEPRNPRYCYPVYDRLGLSEHYREITVSSGRVIEDWGEDAYKVLQNYKKTTKVPLCEYWDLEKKAVWIKGKTDRPIDFSDHKLPRLPIVSTIAEGSATLFDDPKYQRRPFLFTMIRSGLWKRQNLAMTVLYTMLFAIGANPMFVYKRNAEGKKLQYDSSTPGKVLYIDNNEDFQSLLKNAIDPSILAGLEIADNKVTESTIFKQALGQPIGANSAYSMVALLSQAGRLPLVSPQRKISYLISQALETGFSLLKNNGGSSRAQFGGVGVDLDIGEIPDELEIDVNLRIKLPQDEVQAAQMAVALTSPSNPIVPVEWVHKNLLNEEQSKEMFKKIWKERAANTKAEEYIKETLAKIQMLAKAIDEETSQRGMSGGGGMLDVMRGMENMGGAGGPGGGPIPIGEPGMTPPENIPPGMVLPPMDAIGNPGEAPSVPPAQLAPEQMTALNGPMNMPAPNMGGPKFRRTL